MKGIRYTAKFKVAVLANRLDVLVAKFRISSPMAFLLISASSGRW